MQLHTAPLKRLATGIYDGPHATPKESDEGPIFLGIKNVTAEGRLDLSEIRHVAEEDFAKWTRRVVPQKDDLVFSYEATLHLYARIPEGFRGCLGRRMALIRPDPEKIEPRFFHYYLLSPIWREKMEAITIVGATVNRIPLTLVPDVEVSVPDLATQATIADILSAYDDLIENNRRRITLLEQAARELYREWFVRLRFPGHEHVKIIDGVPEGWEACKVSQLLAKAPSTKKIPKDEYRYDGRIPCVDQSQDFIGGYTDDSEAAIGAPLPLILFGDHTRCLKYIDFPFARGADGTQLLIPSKEEITPIFLYFALEAIDLSNFFYARHFKFLKAATLVLPPEKLIKDFTDFAAPNMTLISQLRRHIKLLGTARDLLLPRLMNGSIPV